MINTRIWRNSIIRKCNDKDIFYEKDLRWKCVFEILYYCGLRKWELKGLTWKDIYFDKKVLSVNKQITQRNNRVKFEFSDTKTNESFLLLKSY